jgi:hypothetical protein
MLISYGNWRCFQRFADKGSAPSLITAHRILHACRKTTHHVVMRILLKPIWQHTLNFDEMVNHDSLCKLRISASKPLWLPCIFYFHCISCNTETPTYQTSLLPVQYRPHSLNPTCCGATAHDQGNSSYVFCIATSSYTTFSSNFQKLGLLLLLQHKNAYRAHEDVSSSSPTLSHGVRSTRCRASHQITKYDHRSSLRFSQSSTAAQERPPSKRGRFSVQPDAVRILDDQHAAELHLLRERRVPADLNPGSRAGYRQLLSASEKVERGQSQPGQNDDTDAGEPGSVSAG